MAAPWADLDTDCLVLVFRLLDLEDLLASAPLVCRGWRRAASDPSLWRALDLRRDHVARFMPWGALATRLGLGPGARFTVGGLLALCVARAAGAAADVALPPLLAAPADDLARVVVPGCPRLHRLALPRLPPACEARLPGLLPRWPLLERLDLDAKPPPPCFAALAEQLGRHCPRFAGLGAASGAWSREDADALARHLPGLRALCVDRNYMPGEHLVRILDGCRGLRELSARGCVGFDEKDADVLGRGARIPSFDVRGSTLVDERGGGDDDDLLLADGDNTTCCDSSCVDVIVM